MDWITRESHITAVVDTWHAELVHDDETVTFSIMPHRGDSLGGKGRGLELTISYHNPAATRAELEKIADLITLALYE